MYSWCKINEETANMLLSVRICYTRSNLEADVYVMSLC